MPCPRRRASLRDLPVQVGDSELRVEIEAREFALDTETLATWVQDSADIVARYYGKFPIPSARISITGARGGRVVTGRAMPTHDGAVVNVIVGLQANETALRRDWIMIHELIHLAFPSVHRRHQWLSEGLATYVESIARAQAGELTDDQVWIGFLDGMPKGLPRPGDRGLDFTPTWGRTYWGGALFCLLADVEIRSATDNSRSLRDGLKGICAAGYHMMEVGDVSTVLEIADKATGTEVLSTQYRAMRDQPLPEEIDSLWRQLGVSRTPDGVRYDEQAPQAAIRRALTRA